MPIPSLTTWFRPQWQLKISLATFICTFQIPPKTNAWRGLFSSLYSCLKYGVGLKAPMNYEFRKNNKWECALVGWNNHANLGPYRRWSLNRFFPLQETYKCVLRISQKFKDLTEFGFVTLEAMSQCFQSLEYILVLPETEGKHWKHIIFEWSSNLLQCFGIWLRGNAIYKHLKFVRFSLETTDSMMYAERIQSPGCTKYQWWLLLEHHGLGKKKHSGYCFRLRVIPMECSGRTNWKINASRWSGWLPYKHSLVWGWQKDCSRTFALETSALGCWDFQTCKFVTPTFNFFSGMFCFQTCNALVYIHRLEAWRDMMTELGVLHGTVKL